VHIISLQRQAVRTDHSVWWLWDERPGFDSW